MNTKLPVQYYLSLIWGQHLHVGRGTAEQSLCKPKYKDVFIQCPKFEQIMEGSTFSLPLREHEGHLSAIIRLGSAENSARLQANVNSHFLEQRK